MRFATRSALLWLLVFLLPMQALAASSMVWCGAFQKRAERALQVSIAQPPCHSFAQLKTSGPGASPDLPVAQKALDDSTSRGLDSESTPSTCSLCDLCGQMFVMGLGLPSLGKPSAVRENFAPVRVQVPAYLTGRLDRPPRAANA